MAEETKTSGTSWLWWALGIAAVVLVLFWIFQSMSGTPGVPNTGAATTTSTTSSSSGGGGMAAGGAATVSTIVQDPTQYDGQVVNIDGTVTKVFGPRVMMIGEVGSLGGKGMLVISPRKTEAAAGDNVTIAGKVQVGVAKDALSKIGVTLPSSVTDLAGNQAILVATTVSKSSGSSSQGGATSSSSSQQQGGGSTTMPPSGTGSMPPPQTE